MGCRGCLGGRTPETVSGMLTPDFARYSLALLHEGRTVYSSEKGGLRPLVECIRACRGRFSGCELHDRAIGLAAAKLVVASGMIGRIITRRASARAVVFLEATHHPAHRRRGRTDHPQPRKDGTLPHGTKGRSDGRPGDILPGDLRFLRTSALGIKLNRPLNGTPSSPDPAQAGAPP